MLNFTNGISLEEREKKEQDQKATTEPSDEFGRRVKRERDRMKVPPLTLSTQRKPVVLGCSKYALANPGLLPPLPTQRHARHCRRAADG